MLDREFREYACARLRALRQQSGLTESDVAEHLQIPTGLYVLYEEQELVPHQMLPQLCELLNVSPWYYLTGRPDSQSPPFGLSMDCAAVVQREDQEQR